MEFLIAGVIHGLNFVLISSFDSCLIGTCLSTTSDKDDN